MNGIVSFDIAAIVIFSILIFSVITRGMIKTKETITFVAFLAVALVTALLSLICTIADNYLSLLPETVRFVLNGLYLLARTVVGPFYCFYVLSIADIWHKFKRKKLIRLILQIPYLAICYLIIQNIWNHNVYYFNRVGKYNRGRLFYLLYPLATTYIIFALYIVFRYRRSVMSRKMLAIASVIPFSLVSVMIQYYIQNSNVEMFATAIACFIIAITAQKPEDIIDKLSGIGNFKAYGEDIKRGFYNEKPMKIIVVDINNFATISSMVGFETANKIVRNIGRKLTAINQECESDARMYHRDSGKFRIIIDEKNFDKAEQYANMFNSYIKTGIELEGLELNLITYISLVDVPEDFREYDSFANYCNEVVDIVPYSGEIIYAKDVINNARYCQVSDVSRLIEDGLAYGKFEVYYQPIYSIKEGKFTSAEALLRLKDDKGNFIPPDVFIPVSEKNGNIHKIGDFVIDEVIRFIASEEFCKTDLKYIEVNLSVNQCMQSGLADKVIETLERYKISPEKLNLEITESAAIYSQKIMMQNINKMSKAGISLSLDDYGTGYSNIQRVASLPLKIVKLDKTFVDMQDNPRMWIVLQNTIRMLKDMEVEIVVEGVENKQMLDKFAELECEHIQGYYFSKPLPREKFVEFLLSKKISA